MRRAAGRSADPRTGRAACATTAPARRRPADWRWHSVTSAAVRVAEAGGSEVEAAQQLCVEGNDDGRHSMGCRSCRTGRCRWSGLASRISSRSESVTLLACLVPAHTLALLHPYVTAPRAPCGDGGVWEAARREGSGDGSAESSTTTWWTSVSPVDLRPHEPGRGCGDSAPPATTGRRGLRLRLSS